jgi:hypothetical protein
MVGAGLHPVHFAVTAFVQPFMQPLSPYGIFSRCGYPTGGKAQAPRFLREIGFKFINFGGVNQTFGCSCSRRLHSAVKQ